MTPSIGGRRPRDLPDDDGSHKEERVSSLEGTYVAGAISGSIVTKSSRRRECLRTVVHHDPVVVYCSVAYIIY